MGITQPQLSRIENGPPVRDLGKLIYWARIFDIPPHLLWFKLPEHRDLPMYNPRLVDRQARDPKLASPEWNEQEIEMAGTWVGLGKERY